MFGTTNFNSGAILQSGGTDLYNIFLTGDVDVEINIQPGLNTYTGGTSLNPTVNISAATLSYLSAATISGGTFYSGSTDIDSIFATQTSLSNYTTVAVFTGYTASTNTTLNYHQTEISSLSGATSAYTLNTDYSAYTALTQNQLNTKANLSGATFTGNIYSPTITGATFYSGSTPLNTIINNIAATYSGVTGNFLSISGGTVTGNTVFTSSLSAVTFSATTYYSGSTSLKSAILNNTGVSATTYGSSTQIPIITIQADGRILSASTTSIIVPPNANSNIYLFYNY